MGLWLVAAGTSGPVEPRVDECPLCGASVAVARQFQHKRWHHEMEKRHHVLEQQVDRISCDVRAVLRELVRARREDGPAGSD